MNTDIRQTLQIKKSQIKFRTEVSCFLSLLAVTVFLCSCQSNEPAVSKTKILYTSVYKHDTASLKLHSSDKEFDGQMEINYNGLYKDSGDVNGIIKGDTLKGTFYFQHYGIEKKERIPISLLKRGSKLIMGVGSMEIYMNMTFFKKTVPINYEEVKFIFEQKK
jgi:hypothetical protein